MALLLAVFAVGVYVTIERALAHSFDESLAATARAIAGSIKQEKDNTIDCEFDDQEMPEFRRARHPAYYELRLEDGSVLKRSVSLAKNDLPSSDGPSAASAFLALRLPDGNRGRAIVLVFRPQVEYEDEDGQQPVQEVSLPPRTVSLTVARETSALEAQLAMLKWLLGGAAAGTLLLALLVGAVTARLGLRPLDALAARIAAIREDDLSATVPARGLPVEIVPIAVRLNELLGRLNEAFRRERTLTADVAHELRTPLAGMRSTLEVALSRNREAAEYQQALGDCLDITRQTQSMVDNLMALARLEGGQVSLRPEPVKIADLVEAQWQPFAQRARGRGIAWHNRLPGDLECAADRNMLAMVLSNLLANAAEYADDGGRIEVSGRSADRRAVLALTNSGCRLSAAEAFHVFERFWRGDAARTGTGAHCGLGLALVERAVKALGGSVSADVAGGLFTVRVTLPVQ
jgi:signal transduction histidine kinase